MDYLLENLDGNSFQRLCQSLVVRSHPKAKCFPLNQKDGGRDAVSLTPGTDASTAEYIVFQAKFVQNPYSEEATHKKLLSTVEKELPKIQKLVAAGATEFFLITNVPGTAAPGSGSIDKLDALLSQSVDIPCYTWWRDDICRRLDGEPAVKWMFPDILTAKDVLKYVVEAGITEGKERRHNAIRAFVRDQFEQDKKVKFKQIELENTLFDLFVDVPITANTRTHRNRALAIDGSIRQLASDLSVEPEQICATDLLLSESFMQAAPKVVLEGAPGQGKSTITQYICQVYRARLLGEPLPSRPSSVFAHSALRLPFRVDLRDLATWRSGINPFSLDKEQHNAARSLEQFLSFLVHHHSGGAEFSISDLQAVLALSPITVIFDGLDEVAGISKRKDVIDEVVRGVNRISDVAISVQVIVTSRPAAFANAPGLPESAYPYFELLSLTSSHILEYAEKWICARGLHNADGASVRKILREKLDQPHLIDLARNPMQLAILLSLIHTRGTSLPDKRTALYDKYIELFFNREAEKSEIVRDHRELLIDIHQYLGWLLHTGAETKTGSGNISASELQDVVHHYLNSEGYETALVDKLFTGVVERVVALISRVEGYYEFEVQPLREYFAAKYLYATARYSPAGGEQAGTLPDRFDAIARNPYWLNVTRFFSGCYSKGELPSLVDKLEDLTEDELYKYTSHPRTLAATLLSDWVFSQHPKSMRKAVDLMLHGIALRRIASFGTRRRGRNIPITLPKKCGNEELISAVFAQLMKFPQRDYRESLYGILRDNTSQAERTEHWQMRVDKTDAKSFLLWMEIGLHLGVFSNLPVEQIGAMLFKDNRDLVSNLAILLKSNRLELLNDMPQLRNALIEGIFLRQIIASVPRIRDRNEYEALVIRVSPIVFGLVFHHREPLPLSVIWQQFGWRRFNRTEGAPDDYDSYSPEISSFVKCVEQEAERPTHEWATSIEPWNNIVERARTLFGDKWAFYALANMGAGITSRVDKCEDAADLFDANLPMCARARYARLRAGNAIWWMRCFENAESEQELAFALLLFITWSGPSTFVTCATRISNLFDRLPSQWQVRIVDAANEACSVFNERDGRIPVDRLPEELSPALVGAAARRWPGSLVKLKEHYYPTGYEGSVQDVHRLCQESALFTLEKSRTEPEWKAKLSEISKAYSNGVIPEHLWLYGNLFVRKPKIPYDVAKTIVEHAGNYPVDLVTVAEHICRERAETQSEPVAEISKREGWFDE